MADTISYAPPIPTIMWEAAGSAPASTPPQKAIIWEEDGELPYIPPPLNFQTFVQDVVPPVVTWVTPAPGTTISADAEIIVDITDDTGLWCNYAVRVAYPFASPDRPEETIYTGTRFADFYSTSTIVAITNGFRFTLRRRDGWPSTPKIEVDPVDAGGNRST